MEIFGDVCREFGLPAGDQAALTALMVSMMDDCVVAPGERPRSPSEWCSSEERGALSGGGRVVTFGRRPSDHRRDAEVAPRACIEYMIAFICLREGRGAFGHLKFAKKEPCDAPHMPMRRVRDHVPFHDDT